MGSTLLQIADALVAELNDGVARSAFGEATFAAERSYNPIEDLLDESLVVSVYVQTEDNKLLSRSEDEATLAVNVAINRKLNPQDPEKTIAQQADDLMATVELIKKFIRWDSDGGRRKLALAADASYVSLKHSPVYAPELLRNNNEFLSVLTVSYRVRQGA